MCARCWHPHFSPTRCTVSRILASSSLRAPRIALRSGLPLNSISSATVIVSAASHALDERIEFLLFGMLLGEILIGGIETDNIE